MNNTLKTWSKPEIKMIDVDQTLSSPSPAQAENTHNSQQNHVPGGALIS